MSRRGKTEAVPSWDRLYELAAAKEGHFTTAEAAEAGYSPPLLNHYLQIGRIRRVRRGIYRLVHFPPGEHEDLVAIWLWAEREGVFSHETALSLRGLSDILPARMHITLPLSWAKRRLRVPKGVILHFGEVPESDRAWNGAVPVTSPLRTLRDCVEAYTSPETILQAVRDARSRGMVTKPEADEIVKSLSERGKEG